MSYGLEVDIIAKAHGKDMLTTPYVFNTGEAEAMAKAGADIIVAHMGLTTESIGAETSLKLKDCPKIIDEWAEAARKIRKDVIILCPWRPNFIARGSGIRPEEHAGNFTASMAQAPWSGSRSRLR